MKKILALLGVLCLLVSLAAPALASEPLESVFTHPEVGEIMKVSFNEGMPYFMIYGYVYYQLMPPSLDYRGLKVNQTPLINDRMPSLAQSLDALFQGVKAQMDEKVLVTFEYKGIMEEYAKELEALGAEDRIKAIRILNGFDGVKGFKALKEIPGFENVDLDALKDSYRDYFVQVNGKKMEYRLLNFYFEEVEWDKCYFEHYCYLKVGKDWKLARITKEYTGEYRQRANYLHGMAGALPENLIETNSELMQMAEWKMPMEDVENIKGAYKEGKLVKIDDVTIFRIPASLSFGFKGNKLSKVEYSFQNVQSFYSAFISLYIRYIDPIEVDEKGNMAWYTNDMKIQLNYDAQKPTMLITPYQ